MGMSNLPDLATLQADHEAYSFNGPGATDIVARLRCTRQKLIDLVAGLDDTGLMEIYHKDLIGYIHHYITSDFVHHPLSTDEADMLTQMSGLLGQNGVFYSPAFVIVMLLSPACRIEIIDPDVVPAWLLQEYLHYITQHFKILPQDDDLPCLQSHFERYMQLLLAYRDRPQRQHDVFDLHSKFLLYAGFINFYGSPYDCRTLWRLRADMVEHLQYLKLGSLSGATRLLPAEQKRFRIGILADSFVAGTEGYFALSHWHDLPRDRLDLTLFSISDEPSGLEHYAAEKADHFICLGMRYNWGIMTQAAERIRAEKIDVLIIASNITAVQKPISFLAACRLAPIQLINSATPVSSGLRAADGYLSAAFNERPDGQDDYSEELLLLPRSVNFYAYHFDHQPGTMIPDRQSLGLPIDKKLIFAGGNFIKLTPALLKIWAQIMAACPDAHLVMMPYSPGWLSGAMPEGILRAQCDALFTAAGADPAAITLIPTVPSRVDRHAIMRLCDLYIDSFPFSGACSMLDPLLCGLPIVARSELHFRGLLSTAMLRECGLEDMACADDQSYIVRAIRLIQDDKYRKTEAQRVDAVQKTGLPFFDTVTYGQRLADVIIDTIEQRQAQDAVLCNTAPDMLRHQISQINDMLMRDDSAFFADLGKSAHLLRIITHYFAHQDTERGYFVDMALGNGTTAQSFLRLGWHGAIIASEPSDEINKLHKEYQDRLVHYPAYHDIYKEKADFIHTSGGSISLNQSGARIILISEINNIPALIGTDYRALYFWTQDPASLAWPERNIAVTHDINPIPNARISHVILYRQDDRYFLAHMLRQLISMLRFSDRPQDPLQPSVQ